MGFSTLVTVAARFRHTSEAGGLLGHIGAISELDIKRNFILTSGQCPASLGNRDVSAFWV